MAFKKCSKAKIDAILELVDKDKAQVRGEKNYYDFVKDKKLVVIESKKKEDSG